MLKLHKGQMQAHRSTKRFILVCAGTQGGKTSYGPYWLSREIDTCGPGDYLAVTASYDLFRLKMLPALREHFEGDRGWRYLASDRVLTSPSGKSRIILRSAEAEGGLEAATAKAAWLDECGQPSFAVTAWEAIYRRLLIHQGRCLLTTTPYTWNWLERISRLAVTDPQWELVRFSSDMNPAFPADQMELARQSMPDWRFRMFYLGEFTRPAAAIFADYDDVLHVEKGLQVSPGWPRTVGVDFGLVNTGVIFHAYDTATGMVYAYRELMGGGRSGTEWARECIAYNDPVRNWWGGAGSEDRQRLEWAMGGAPVARPLITDVEGRIGQLVALIRQGRYRVAEPCYNLRNQLISYAREVDPEGNILERIAHKETFHLVDAATYGVCAYPINFKAPVKPKVEREGARVPNDEVERPERRLEVDDYD